MPKYKIILNPVASKGAAGQAVDTVKKTFQELGLDYSMSLTEHPWHAADLAQQAIEEGYDVVVAAGGDGTINEVINGIMISRQAGLGSAKMGVLPIGRGNDFAFSMGIPLDFHESCKAIADGYCKTIDIGRITGGKYPDGRYFGNGVGIGFDAVVGFLAAEGNISGFLGYLVAALKAIFLYYKAPTVDIIIDNETLHQDSLMVSIMNGRRMGGGFMMAPEGDPCDNHFDLCIAAHASQPVILSLIPRFLKGNQAGHPKIQFRKSKGVKVVALKGVLPAHADGETISTHAEELLIELLPSQIDIFTSPDGTHP